MARKPRQLKLSPIGLDFETDPIEQKPHYPPKPVGFSLKLPEWRQPRYFAWDHYTGGNNCTQEQAGRVLRAVWDEVSEERPLLCFNAKFDLDIAEVHFGLKLPDWRCWHDAMFLVFLMNPHARDLGLKPSAVHYLGLPPEEQDAVKAWVLAHKKQLEAQFPEITERYEGIKPSTAGAYVAYTPVSLAGPYADGDLIRTHGLFDKLYPQVLELGMGPAYDRERQVMPIFLRNEHEGIRTDGAALERDLEVYEKAQAKADEWLRKRLKAPGLDFNKDNEVAKVLDREQIVTDWALTSTGKLSTSKNNLKLSHFHDQKVAAAYSYRKKCATVLETFIRPWIRFSANGWMRTTWNQTRQANSEGDANGTRSGRPSSKDPNFLNMPRPFKDAAENKDSQYIYPVFLDVPALPKIRDYILPDEKDHWIGRRDFNQQEIRILAHYENGPLMQAYLDNPRLDVHHYLMLKILNEMGIPIDRYSTKQLTFGYIYGQGLPSLAAKLEKSVEEVKVLRNAQMAVMPGLKGLSGDIKTLANADQPIVTFGGRLYYKEPSVYSEKHGRWLDFTYKLINYICQPSAADITKESLIRYDAVRKEGRLLLSVYDENVISGAKKALPQEMLLLRDAMMSVELDVPLISDGEWGPKLGSLTAMKEPEPDLSRWGIKW